MKLSEKSILVNLHMSVWTGRKHDKQATAEIAANHGNRSDMGRYHKRLLGSAASFDSIRKLAGEIREYHYSRTLPWSQDGPRILPSASYMDYAETMRRLRGEFQTLVAVFVSDFPVLREESKLLLNGLYKDSDYPKDIGSYFDFTLSILPMPDADDFRVKLSADEIDRLKSEMSAEVNSAMSVAMRDVWSRLYTAVSKMTERLSDPEAIFRDSLMSNLSDLCKLLPALNLTDDATLDTLRQTVETSLLTHSADTLRDNKQVRATVAKQAADIQTIMSGFMGGVA